MSHTTADKMKQMARIRRIKGQVEAIERAIDGDGGPEDLLQLVASCRGALNGLMAALIEGHVRFHLLPKPADTTSAQLEAAEELILVVKRYLS